MTLIAKTKKQKLFRNCFRIFEIENSTFEVPSHYRCTQMLGEGAFGSVCEAKDEQTGKWVAIKKCRNVFQETDGVKPIPMDVLREIKMLEFCKHPHIITLEEILPVRSNFDEVYIVTDKMDTTLCRVLKSSGSLSHKHTQYFMAQLISAIYYLHSAGILHRDIKTSNILVNQDCTLKLCDLGLARSKHQDTTSTQYYVVTRWYRAPELLIKTGNYHEAIDMWAVGVVLVEMLQGSALWPGRGSHEQFQLILEDLGTPSDEEVSYAQYIYSNFPLKRRNFSRDVVQKYGKQAGDLIAQLLTWNPDERLTATETSMHPYLRVYKSSFPLTSSKEQFDWQYEYKLHHQEDIRKEMMQFINNRPNNMKGGATLKDRKAFIGKCTRSRTVLKSKNKYKMKNSNWRSNVRC